MLHKNNIHIVAEGVSEEVMRLMKAAQDARQLAYCPYSDFRVGAAVLCQDNSIYSGMNYSLSINH